MVLTFLFDLTWMWNGFLDRLLVAQGPGCEHSRNNYLGVVLIMETLFVIGRLIYGVPLLYMGIRNFWTLDELTEKSRAKGIPLPKMAVISSTTWFIIGMLAILFNFKVVIGSIMVAIFLVSSGIKIHDFWTVTDPKIQKDEMIQLEKNIIIAGAALAIAAASA